MPIRPGQIYRVSGIDAPYEIEVVSVSDDDRWVECRNRPPMYDGYTFHTSPEAFDVAELVREAR